MFCHSAAGPVPPDAAWDNLRVDAGGKAVAEGRDGVHRKGTYESQPTALVAKDGRGIAFVQQTRRRGRGGARTCPQTSTTTVAHVTRQGCDNHKVGVSRRTSCNSGQRDTRATMRLCKHSVVSSMVGEREREREGERKRRREREGTREYNGEGRWLSACARELAEAELRSRAFGGGKDTKRRDDKTVLGGQRERERKNGMGRRKLSTVPN